MDAISDVTSVRSTSSVGSMLRVYVSRCMQRCAREAPISFWNGFIAFANDFQNENILFSPIIMMLLFRIVLSLHSVIFADMTNKMGCTNFLSILSLSLSQFYFWICVRLCVLCVCLICVLCMCSKNPYQPRDWFIFKLYGQVHNSFFCEPSSVCVCAAACVWGFFQFVCALWLWCSTQESVNQSNLMLRGTGKYFVKKY